MRTSLQNSKSAAGTADLPEQVINPPRTFTGFIVADSKQPDKRRGQEPIEVVLARVYRYILSEAWGQHGE